MVAGEPVCVFYDPLLTDIHQDGLTAHGADVVREVLGRHARCTVVLGKTGGGGAKQLETLWGHQTGGGGRQGRCSSTYPHSGSHEVRAHFSKVSSQNPVVEPVEEQRHAKVHGILWLYPEETRRPRGILTHLKNTLTFT